MKRSATGRRNFLKGAAAGAAALVAKPKLAEAQPQQAQRGSTPLPSAAQAARETAPPPHADVYTTDRPGSDFMAEVIKSLGFEYCTLNPGSSFRGLHESLINLGPAPNRNPEMLTCCHEESAVAMAHGYYKIEGKPMLVMAHGTVGLQHASMAIYNAYADRVPGLHHAGQHSGRNLAPQRRRMDPQRPGLRLHGARLHQVGRRARFARSNSPNRPCAPTRSP